jgi:hypothetical protein
MDGCGLNVEAWEGIGKFAWYLAQVMCLIGAGIGIWMLFKTLMAPSIKRFDDGKRNLR